MEVVVNETVAVAKKKREEDRGPVRTLSTGVRVRLKPVPMGLWQDALKMLRRKEPKVPTFVNKDKGGRVEENPSDPDYQVALVAYAEEQQSVTSDILLMFGVDLVDGVPEDTSWLRKLQVLERMGTVDLSQYDLDDDIALEFVYKKYVAAGPRDAALLGSGIGASEEEIDESVDFFPGDTERGEDRELSSS